MPVAPDRGLTRRELKGASMPVAAVNETELYYEARGAGEVLLFHHGHTGSHETWAGVVPAFAEHYRCIVMDARGAGDSARPSDGYTIPQLAADVIGLLDALGVERCTFIGHSLGGGVGMWLGLEHAARLDRLVLVAPIGADGYAADPAAVARGQALRAAGDREQLLRERRAGLARSERFDESAARAAIERSLSVSDGHYNGLRAAMGELRIGSRLPSLRVPTLVIAGAADSLCAANVQDALRMGNATLHVFSRAGHSPQHEEPAGFNAVLQDFLSHGVVNAATLAERLRDAQAVPAS